MSGKEIEGNGPRKCVQKMLSPENVEEYRETGLMFLDEGGKMKQFIAILIVFCFWVAISSAENIETDCYNKTWKIASEGSRLMQSGNYPDAIVAFNEAAQACKQCLPTIEADREKKLKGICTGVYLGLEAIYSKQSQFEKAIAVCEEAANIMPDYAWGFFNQIAFTYSMQGKYNKAIEVCMKTLSAFPESSTTYYMLGSIYYRIGEYQKAKENFKKFLEFSKDEKEKMDREKVRKILQSLP